MNSLQKARDLATLVSKDAKMLGESYRIASKKALEEYSVSKSYLFGERKMT